jgi:SAM-dependent methyltransferase
VIDEDMLAFVTESLPEPPARILEVGAGRGELADALRERGYDVRAIDPATESESVERLRLHEVDEPDGSFDAAVAVLSLHHVEPLAESFDRLAALLPSGAPLVVDEFDVACFDERAAAWQIAERELGTGHHGGSAEDMVRGVRDHLHPIAAVRAQLQRSGFALGALTRGPYLYRWELPPGLRGPEEQLIEAGHLPATGARFLATRN